MSQRTKLGLLGTGAFVAMVTVFVAATLLTTPAVRRADADSAEPPIREIVLSARGVAFGENNPTLELRTGETVRITIRNDDVGVVHSVTLPGLDSEVKVLAPGESASFEITPSEPGTFEYTCPLHLPLMKGRVVVSQSPSKPS